MDSLTHFHLKNLHFYINYSYSLKDMALFNFPNFWADTNLRFEPEEFDKTIPFFLKKKGILHP